MATFTKEKHEGYTILIRERITVTYEATVTAPDGSYLVDGEEFTDAPESSVLRDMEDRIDDEILRKEREEAEREEEESELLLAA